MINFVISGHFSIGSNFHSVSSFDWTNFTKPLIKIHFECIPLKVLPLKLLILKLEIQRFDFLEFHNVVFQRHPLEVQKIFSFSSFLSA